MGLNDACPKCTLPLHVTITYPYSIQPWQRLAKKKTFSSHVINFLIKKVISYFSSTFLHFFLSSTSFVLKVLPKTGFFAIPSNLLQVEKFNFLWIKLGSNWKQGLQQSFEKKAMADSKKVQHSTNKKSSNIGIFDKKFTKGLLTWIFRWFPQVSVSPRSFQLKSPPLVFLAVFPKKLLWPGFLTDVVGEQNVRKVN